jgi:hypothetical protein
MVSGWIGFLLIVAYLGVGAYMFDLNPLQWHSFGRLVSPSSERKARVRSRVERVGLVRWFSLLVLALVCFAIAGNGGQ